jgi:hypothetical protein
LFVPDHDFQMLDARAILRFAFHDQQRWRLDCDAVPGTAATISLQGPHRPVQGRRSPRLIQRPGCDDDDDDGKSPV